jgi:hypothetical protein
VVDRVCLPFFFGGINLDISSSDLKGTSVTTAHAVLIASEESKQDKKVVVMAATEEFLSDVEAEIREMTKSYDSPPRIARLANLPSGDADVQIILALPSDRSKEFPSLKQLVVVCELNAIIR